MMEACSVRGIASTSNINDPAEESFSCNFFFSVASAWLTCLAASSSRLVRRGFSKKKFSRRTLSAEKLGWGCIHLHSAIFL